MPRPDSATPRRTRGHVIADLSVNFVERYILEAAHVPHGIHRDYGYDLTVVTHSASGFAEAGHFFIQVKAAETLSVARGRPAFRFPIARRHLNLWRHEPMPVFLIGYAADVRRAFWMYVQPYLAGRPELFRTGRGSATILIPAAQRFGPAAVEYMASKTREVVRDSQRTVYHEA
jgi:hypothetical protein